MLSHANSSRAPNHARKLRIIVADDSRDAVLTLSAILTDEGHDVYGVHSAEEVTKTVRLITPDVVILDIEMPGMSGYALAQELRSLYYGSPRAPLLIAISGKWVKTCDQRVARAVGFAHHLMKPCDPNELLQLIAPLQKISPT
jgi:CheY-like chemotaxis protein